MTSLTDYDTVDDRREMLRMIEALKPVDRYRFVYWCIARSKSVDGRKPPTLYLDDADRRRVELATRTGDPKSNEHVTVQAYGFVLMLAHSWKLDVAAAVKTLESLAKGRVHGRDLLR